MTDIHSAQSPDLPNSELDVAKMPGHWLLAHLGKRVQRPGGLKLTRALVDELAAEPADEVVEFAPGLGVTARMILQRGPRYTGVERDAKATQWTPRQLSSNSEGIGCSRPRRSDKSTLRACLRSHWRGNVEHADRRT